MKIKIIMVLFMLFTFVTKVNHKIPIIPDRSQVSEVKTTKLTPVNVYQKIIEYEIEHPRIVFSQVMLETGRLKSDGAKIDNNLFGFRTKKGYKTFETWEESVKYYKNWQDRRYSGGNYYAFLKNVKYAQDSTYIDKLTVIEKNLDKKWSGTITF